MLQSFAALAFIFACIPGAWLCLIMTATASAKDNSELISREQLLKLEPCGSHAKPWMMNCKAIVDHVADLSLQFLLLQTLAHKGSFPMHIPGSDHPKSLFGVLNPMGGNCDPDQVRAALDAHCARSGQSCEIYQTTGAEDEDVPARVREAVAAGAELVIAIGGDGTVSQVGEGVAGSSVPMAVIPTGTANVFVREMGIPLEVEAACALLSAFRTRAVDGIVCDGHLYLLHLGVGLSSLMIRDTDQTTKRRFGRSAYVWTAIRTLSGLQPHRFEIQVDGTSHRLHAKQVFIANSGIWGIQAVRIGDHVAPDDGIIDLCILNGRTLFDFALIAWDFFTQQHHRNRGIRYLSARESIALDCRPRLPVQGDGEIIGYTPIRLGIRPGVVHVAVPIQADKE